MAIGMSRGKVDRVGLYFKQGLLREWEFEEDADGLYEYGAVIARRGDVKAVLDIGYAPFLRVSIGGGKEDLITLPLLETERLGVLAASIARAIARARDKD